MCSASPSRKPATSRSRSASEGNTRPRKMSRWRSAGTPETEATLAFNAAMEAWCFGSNRKRASVVASFAASFPTKKKEKKRRLTKRRTTTTREERCGRRARRTRRDAAGGTHVDGKRQAVFARGLLLPHAHADRGLRAGGLRRGGNRGARHRDDLLPFFHLGSDVTSVPACPPSPLPSPSISSIESLLPPRTASARRDAGRVPLACPRARMSARHEGCAR